MMGKFKSNAAMPRDPGPAGPFLATYEPHPRPDVVRSMMTPGEAHEYNLSDYPRHDWMDVKHVRKE